MTTTYLRLRQICLVASELEPVVDDLCAVFGVKVCHRDPEVGQFGLHNALMPFGSSFLEVVAPQREGTAAGRYLERRQGDGGYMVILDSEALPRWRANGATSCSERLRKQAIGRSWWTTRPFASSRRRTAAAKAWPP